MGGEDSHTDLALSPFSPSLMTTMSKLGGGVNWAGESHVLQEERTRAGLEERRASVSRQASPETPTPQQFPSLREASFSENEIFSCGLSFPTLNNYC